MSITFNLLFYLFDEEIFSTLAKNNLSSALEEGLDLVFPDAVVQVSSLAVDRLILPLLILSAHYNITFKPAFSLNYSRSLYFVVLKRDSYSEIRSRA